MADQQADPPLSDREPALSRVKTISVVYGRKINLGDYNSAELALTVWADVEKGVSADDARAELQAFARESVKEEFIRLHKGHQASKRNGN